MSGGLNRGFTVDEVNFYIFHEGWDTTNFYQFHRRNERKTRKYAVDSLTCIFPSFSSTAENMILTFPALEFIEVSFRFEGVTKNRYAFLFQLM